MPHPAQDNRIRHTLTLRQALDAFLLDCRARNLAAGTVGFYGEKLTKLLAYLAEAEVNTVAEITPSQLRAFLLWLQEEGHNPGGRHAHATAARAWLNWLVKEGELEESPMKRVKMPKQEKRILPAFTKEDIDNLLKAVASYRDRAMILFLLDTGLRASELLALNVGDVDLLTGAVAVHLGKGRKGRTVYLGAQARIALQRYLRRRGYPAETAPLWATHRNSTRLRIAGLRQALRRAGNRAGVAHSHPHTFRRTFALWSLRAGMNIYALQGLMGHEDLTMLRRYLALVESDLQDAHRRHGPVNSTLGNPQKESFVGTDSVRIRYCSSIRPWETHRRRVSHDTADPARRCEHAPRRANPGAEPAGRLRGHPHQRLGRRRKWGRLL